MGNGGCRRAKDAFCGAGQPRREEPAGVVRRVQDFAADRIHVVAKVRGWWYRGGGEKEPGADPKSNRNRGGIGAAGAGVAGDAGRRGAVRLHALLEREGLMLPTITIHRILLRHHLVRSQDRHRAAVQRFSRGAPNQLWQMDFKGPVGWQAPVGPLSIVDDHSRYVITLYGTWSSKAEPVKERLEEAFERCGLPEAMLMDHGTPWWNMKAATGWTWLTVWMVKQGIQVHFSGYRHPQTQGKVERFHGSLGVATQRRGWPWGAERQRWLDEFRLEYNHVRPHEALGMKTPATVWSKSERKYEPRRPAWEYERGAEVRKLADQGQLQLAGRRWEISRALAGERVKLVRVEGRILVYYCRSLVRELDLPHQRSTSVDRWWDMNPDPEEARQNV